MKFSDNWLDRVSAGKISGASIIYKFGAATVNNGDYQVITSSGVYPTPSTAQTANVELSFDILLLNNSTP